MLNERRRLILAALVEEYIHSAQPVASKRLVDRYHVKASPATVRNDLAHLEETGYVYQPHVSAGRIPTDTGYRAFVDGLAEAPRRRTTLSPAELEAVADCYSTLERQISDLMRETSVMLSRLTSYVAVVLAPVLQRSRIRRIDLVPLSSRRALVVVITDSGRVANRVVDLEDDVTAEELREAERFLNATSDDRAAEEVRAFDGDEPAVPCRRVVPRVLREVLDCLGETDGEQLYRGGTASLLDQPEFADSRVVRPLIALLEDGVEMLRVLDEAMEAEDVVVRIGHENAAPGLEQVSFVARNYTAGGAEGIVGLIGPTRMDYERAISAVRVVAEGLSEALGQ
jgi:heat-inducible transcriptional repressor